MANRAMQYDLIVIGGGINGAGIARDAAGRGLSVLLCEQDDLARHTSSASTKLIHGGLRYLEHFEFALVRKALLEREVLLRNAPHIMHPMRFVMPCDTAMRPAWMIRIGLFLYDHLARRKLLAASGTLDLHAHPAGAPLQPGFSRGFIYSDGWVDDARLVVLNALDAHERGATILTRTRCVGAVRGDDGWSVCLQNTEDGSRRHVTARALVNAAGPWVAELLAGPLQVTSRHRIRLVKGSHIVVPRLFAHEYAYLFQNPDQRIIFAIPYEHAYTLIGTTDVDFAGPAASVTIDAQEVDYLCAMANRYFQKQITPRDVVHTYSGVRPLLDDQASSAAEVTRDYWLELNEDGAPVLSVFGGKITTFRKLAEEALDKLLPVLDRSAASTRKKWTANAPLPGGDLDGGDVEAFATSLAAELGFLPVPLVRRLAHAYGSRVRKILAGATTPGDLGIEVAPGLFECELVYLRDHEWARTTEDLLWRRSKLGLHYDEARTKAVADWMENHRHV